MFMKSLAAALLGASLIAAPALAQSTDTKAPPAKSDATQQKAAPAAKSDEKAAPAKSAATKNEQNASATGMWQGSKLIGLNVYNGQNEKIGDIKELMINKEGHIDTVAIAVGGFLGMGEHDVAVKFSELKWQDEPVRSTTSSTRPSGSPTTGVAPTATKSSAPTKRNYPDHAVLDSSKDQLKSMPQFNYNK
jgi:sporulation protein YlmC with PRC-barrel domain